MWKWTGSMSMRTGKRTVLDRLWTGKMTVWTVPTHDRTKVRAQLHSCLLLHCYCFVYEHRHCMRRVTSILSRRLHSVWICSPSFATPSSRDTPLPTSNVSRFRSTQYTSLRLCGKKRIRRGSSSVAPSNCCCCCTRLCSCPQAELRSVVGPGGSFLIDSRVSAHGVTQKLRIHHVLAQVQEVFIKHTALALTFASRVSARRSS